MHRARMHVSMYLCISRCVTVIHPKPYLVSISSEIQENLGTGLGFRGLGFRGLGFRVQGFRGLGFGI